MSRRIELTAAVGDYDIHRSLVSGEAVPDGIDLTVLTLRSQERHWRMLRNQEFDIAELSMSSYLLMQNRPDPPFIAIPVFPHRRFRHSYIFVHPAHNIRTPKDLEGKKVGLRSWQATMGVWCRGILQDEYGVNLENIEWITQDEEVLEIGAPPGYRINKAPEGADVEQMLLEGEIHGLIYPDLPRSLLAGHPGIARLFTNYKQEEIAYFQKTAIFPIMHVVVMKKSVLDKYPWAALNMMHAFRKSKEDAWRRMKDPRSISLAWLRELIEEEQAILGHDPWPVGIEPNRKVLETLIQYSYDQGMLNRAIPVEELFYPSTREESPDYTI